jgi:hypothetical protein
MQIRNWKLESVIVGSHDLKLHYSESKSTHPETSLTELTGIHICVLLLSAY